MTSRKKRKLAAQNVANSRKRKKLRPDDRDGKQYCKVCWAKGGFKFCKECGAFAKGHKEAKGEKTRFFFCDACWLSFEDKTKPQKTKAAKKAKREGNPKNVTDPQPCAPPTAIGEVRVVLTVPSDPPQELPPTTLELRESVGVSENLSKTAQLSSRKPVISMMSQPVAPQSENTPPAPFNDLKHIRERPRQVGEGDSSINCRRVYGANNCAPESTTLSARSTTFDSSQQKR